MGYYSTILEIPNIKSRKLKEVRELIKKAKSSTDFNSFEPYFLCNTELVKNSLELVDWNRKFYNDHLFAFAFKDFFVKGKLIFNGEDSERWGYYFDGKGKVFELEFYEKKGKELIIKV